MISCPVVPLTPNTPQGWGGGHLTGTWDLIYTHIYAHVIYTCIIYDVHFKKSPSGFQMFYVFNFPNGKKMCFGSQQGPTVDLHTGSIDCQPSTFTQGPLAFQWVRNGIKTCHGFSATKPVGRVQMCIYKQNVHTNAVF